VVRGAVQGVGFRPFVYRLALELKLRGWVQNSAQGVFLEAEGERGELEQLLLRLSAEKPPRSSIQSLEASWLDPVGYRQFEIRESRTDGPKTALVLPDIATCAECVKEIFDPANRRYRYPFTNCTHCGPRFTIIESLPYDRANTAMKAFQMCPRCQAEYDDPANRRFHAQPNACPDCGPRLELWDPAGRVLPLDNPLAAAADAIRAGQIVALKGLGGFQLLVAAGQEPAVRRLRERKLREEKPFALMFPSLESIKQVCEVAPLEERLLRSPECPIVLLNRLAKASPEPFPSVAPSVAPANPGLGVMLPYTPLHHLLLHLLGFPVVATSGNLSDEPICISETDAVARLGRIADLLLVHNRPIVRHADDSIVRLVAGRELVLRRARGYAPLPVPLARSEAAPAVLAVGGHLKNTIALASASHAYLSQHIGDLETDESFRAFERAIGDFQQLFDVQPGIIAADLHPDYLSRKHARDLVAAQPGAKLATVQHHLAHVWSCMAENELVPPVLGVSWDGTGYGLDGTVWGGEFFLVSEGRWDRVAHLRQFRLPGGDKAIKEPRRSALGLLHAAFGEKGLLENQSAPVVQAFTRSELAALVRMLEQGLNSPLTSSVGRLFDAVAALVGLRQITRFEGQAAMELEFAAQTAAGRGHYEFALTWSETPPLWVIDWEPALNCLLEDLRRKETAATIAARFHQGLAEAIVAVARKVGQPRVVLSGGCFQNRLLTERTVARLEAEGFRPYWHQRVPPNDGGLSLGQIVAALHLPPSHRTDFKLS
jgi:hydrogenase maturation protein HypF